MRNAILVISKKRDNIIWHVLVFRKGRLQNGGGPSPSPAREQRWPTDGELYIRGAGPERSQILLYPPYNLSPILCDAHVSQA